VFSLQNAVCFIILTYLVPVLFTFYIQGVLKLKNNYGAKRLRKLFELKCDVAWQIAWFWQHTTVTETEINLGCGKINRNFYSLQVSLKNGHVKMFINIRWTYYRLLANRNFVQQRVYKKPRDESIY